MKILFVLAAALPLVAGDFRAHLAGSTLDVYVGECVSQPADIPGAPPADNQLIVSVKTSDDMAQAVMVWVMIRLDDQTRTTRTAVMQRSGDGLLVFRFSLGERRPIELVDIRVDNLRKTFADRVARSY